MSRLLKKLKGQLLNKMKKNNNNKTLKRMKIIKRTKK